MIKGDRALAWALFVSYAIYALLCFNRAERLANEDGFVTTLAYLIHNGRLPHRDFFLSITPGTFFVQALLQQVFGDTLIVGRIYVLLEHLVLFGVLWRTAAITIPSGAGRALPVALLFFGPMFSYPFYSRDALLFASAVLWLTVRYVGGGSSSNLYAAAALAALTVLFKQNIGVASVVFVLGIAVWAYRSERRIERLSIAALAAALATPLALFGVYLAATRSTAAFLDNVVSAPASLKGPLLLRSLAIFLIPDRFGLPLIAGVTSVIVGLRMSGRWRGVLWLGPAIAFALATAWAVARDGKPDRVLTWVNGGVANALMLLPSAICAIALWFLLRQPSQSRAGPPWLSLLFWFSWLHFIAAAAAGASWYHLSMAFPFVYVLAGRVFADATTAGPHAEAGAVAVLVRRRRALCAVAATVVAYGAVVNLFMTAFGAGAFSSWRQNPLSALFVMVNPDCPGLRGMRLSRGEATHLCSVAEYVQGRVGPTEEIFAFPMGMPLYPASQRFSTSYYSHFYSEVIRPDSNRRTIQYLNATGLKLLILAPRSRDASAERRNQIMSADGRASELLEFITANFVSVAVIDRFEILERRTHR